MKKSQVKDATRNIKKRIVSYLSICLVIMLGVGAFLTTRYMEAGLGREAATYEIDHNFKNFEMISSLGVSDSNIELIKQQDGVLDAEGVMEMTATISKGYSKRKATVLSITERISVPELIEGRMPTADDEVALAEDFSEKSGIEVGDRLRIYIKSSNMDYPFRTHSFLVTGLVRHPDYIHRKMANIIVVPLSSFDEEVTDGYYTRVYIKSEDPPADEYYSNKYLKESMPLYNNLIGLAEELEGKRTAEFKADANAKIDEEWAKALAKFDEKQAKIDDGRSTLNSKLAAGRKKLNNAQSKLNKTVKKYKKKLDDAEAKLNKIKKQCKEIDAKLPEIKEELEKLKEKLVLLDAQIAALDILIQRTEEMSDEDWASEEGEALRKEISDKAQETKATLDDIEEERDKTNSPEVTEAAEKIKDVSDGKVDPTGVINGIADYDFNDAESSLDGISDMSETDSREDALEKMRNSRDKVQKCRDDLSERIEEAEKLIERYENEKDKYIADAEKKLKDYRKRLEKARKKYQAKIDAGWNKYYSVKKRYEAKLAEAIALLEESREEAEKKLEEARAEVDKADCKWLALDRKSNAGYIDIKSQVETLHRTGNLFGIMFLLITAMVCLSTLIIIIDEQKTLIGTVKAFGFHKGEVLSKYLLFGVTAAIVGNIMAFIVGTGLSSTVLKIYNGQNMYPFEKMSTVVKPGATLFISLAMLAICALASVIACSDILRSPASMLMKGDTLSGNKAANKKKKESSQKGSLYSKLIIRNIKDDKARVIVSTVIVTACCVLIGLGITVKLSFNGTLDKQSYLINHYDLRMDISASVSDEDKAAINKVLSDSGVEYIEAVYENRIYKSDDGIDALNLICGKPEDVKNYIGVTLDGDTIEIPSDGILLPIKFNERFSFKRGGNIKIFDDEVKDHDVKISGFYNCYFGRLSIMTPESYRTYFGEAPKYNSRYIHLNGVDSEKLRKDILAVNGNVTFDTPTSFRSSVEAVAKLFDIVTLVTTGIAILISFMILTNLANIFLNRKKTELSVMRVNGFSVRQAKGYLARESVLTTFIGLSAGLLIGSLFSSQAIKMIEPINMQLDRSYQWIAWAIAVALEGIFALIIYTSTFRKVKNLNLRDIA